MNKNEIKLLGKVWVKGEYNNTREITSNNYEKKRQNNATGGKFSKTSTNHNKQDSTGHRNRPVGDHLHEIQKAL